METMVLRVDHPTCHPRLIENTAVALADMIFHKKEPTRRLLLRLNASAVRRTSHTRTLSLVVQKLLRELHWRNTELYHDVKEEVLHMAVTTFIDYWKVSVDFLRLRPGRVVILILLCYCISGYAFRRSWTWSNRAKDLKP